MNAASILATIASLPRSATGAVRLSALRAALPGVARADLDSALMSLQNAGNVVLYRDDNTYALTAADKAAAMDVAGFPRHLVIVVPPKKVR